MNKISIEHGVPLGTVNMVLMKNNIPKRSISEAVNATLTHKDEIELSRYNQELLIGNLLGDGSVLKKKKRAFYTHTDKNKEYLEWLQLEMERDGITFSPIRQAKNGTWQLQSHTFSVFNEYRERFYPNGKIIVPNDIKLTQTILRQWYIGDGSVATHGGRHISKEMESPDILLSQLHDLIGKEVTYPSTRFYIPVHLTEAFLKYIGPSPVKCYDYKWR